MSTTSTKKPFFENLDGLRFFCFFSVFLYHSFHTTFDHLRKTDTYQFVNRLFINGNLGVNFFFVLSGFLITYLLIVERNEYNRIDIGKFWMRRILRIWPLYFACVFFGFVIFPFIKQKLGAPPADPNATLGYYLTFTSNFELLYKGLPDASILGVLWSVGIEEQFYLAWPILLSILPVSRYPWILGAIVGGSVVFRSFNPTYDFGEVHTLSCIGDMAIGGIGAWLILSRPTFKEWVERWPRWSIVALYLSFFTVYFFRFQLFQGYHVGIVLDRLLIGVLIIGIILEQNYARHSVVKLSGFPALGRLGRITYGLYCLHMLAILITITLTARLGWNTQVWQVLFLETGVALVLAIVIATISYRYFELFFLKLKDRFSLLH